jgi:hypothetical protein
VSIDRSFLKGEAPRFSTDFTHPLSCGRPFKFPHHLIGSLRINNIIAMSYINIRSAIFNTNTDRDMEKNTYKDKDKDKDTDTDMDKDMYTDMDTDLELKLKFFCQTCIWC